MNQSKQEYMVNFAYKLGVLLQKEGKVMPNMVLEMPDEQEKLKLFNNYIEFLADKCLSSEIENCEEFIKNNFDKLEQEFLNKKEVEKTNKSIIDMSVKLYNELEPIIKTLLSDLEILHVIDLNLDKPDMKTQERLLHIINRVWLKDEENISKCKVADEICEAYRNEEISLNDLENADSRDLLQCVYGYDDFSNYNQNEHIRDLYYQATEASSQEQINVILKKECIIGLCSNMIKLLEKERRSFENEGEIYETPRSDIESLIEYIQVNKQPEEIIGIENNEETGSYKIIDDERIVEILGEIVKDKEEREDEEIEY